MMRMLTLRATLCVLKQVRHTGSSSQAAVQGLSSALCSHVSEKDTPETKLSLENENQSLKLKGGKLVTAAFEKLKTLNVSTEINDSISRMITEAVDVEELLSIVTVKKLTRSHALKIVSVLADWTVEGKIHTEKFEKDPRFAIVCQILGSTPSPASPTADNKIQQEKTSADMETVLSVTTDDEAAKLISNISLNQMVKVLSTLSSKKRRSTPLLRSLAFNIASIPEKLDIKQGADALYALASLNYHDEMLVDKICSDLCSCLMNNTRRAVVGSIITSLGLLKFKHIDLLDLLSEWVEKHLDVCGTQDLTSLVMTLAVVNYTPVNHNTLFPMVIEQLQTNGVPSPHDWLDVVWALTVLNKQTAEQVASVLSPEFAEKIKAVNSDGFTVPMRLKLLNINGVAKLKLKDYKGPLLDIMSEEWKVPLLRSKDKQALVATVQETLLNLVPSAIYLNTNIDTGMGYMIDAECMVNTMLTPLPLFDMTTKKPIDRSGPDTQRGIKVAIKVRDYHDMTRGRRELTGMNFLCDELTRLSGYRIMKVDHLDFNPRFKLLNRVQYLNQQLKNTIGKS